MAKKLTEKEKLALADKMAFKLGKYIGGLDVKLSRSELSEENWNKEMDKHPLFTGKAGKGIKKYIKHDPKNITKEELTLKYKKDGNFYVKHMKFPMAVCIFTEGIKVKCEKMEVLAILYNNRSAANFFLTNYQSALSDAQRTLKLKPDYEKALWRAARCAYHTSDFYLAAELSKKVMQYGIQLETKELAFDLLAVVLTKIMQERFKINLNFVENKVEEEYEVEESNDKYFKRICVALKERRVKFDNVQPNGKLTKKVLTPTFAALRESPVHFYKDGTTLFWPALFGFPEFRVAQAQIELKENIVLKDYLKFVYFHFSVMLNADHCSNTSINVYFVKKTKGETHKIDIKNTVKAIISEANFYITDGYLMFHLIRAGSDYEKKFLEENA